MGRDVNGEISAISGGTVKVNGSVNGENVSVSAWGGTADVKGDVNSGDVGISAANGGKVKVKGDVNAKTGIQITLQKGMEASGITVEGSINSTGNAITVNTMPGAGRGVQMEPVEEILDAMPQIIVQSLNPEADFILVNKPASYSEEDEGRITEALIQKINYIVNQENIDSATIAVYGTSETDGYVTAQETQKLTLRSTDSGYILANVTAGRYADVADNGDGSYTVTVNRGGDLKLSAEIQVRPAAPEESAVLVEGASARYGPALVVPDYEADTLTVDMTTTDYSSILVSTFEHFASRGAGKTIFVRTAGGVFEIPREEFLKLSEGAGLITLYVNREGMLELYADYVLTTTLSVS